MSFESQPLRLLPYRRRLLEDGRSVIETKPGDSFETSAKFKVYFDAVEAGFSLSQMSELAPTSGANMRFERLRQFLLILSDHDLIADKSYRRLAESLSPEYSWPTSMSATELSVIPVVEERGGQSSPSTGLAAGSFIVALVAAAVSIFFLPVALFHNLKLSPESTLTAVSVVIAFVLSFWVGRSFQALLWWLMARGSGHRPSLSLVIEPIGLRLRTDLKGAKFSVFGLLSLYIAIFSVGLISAYAAFRMPGERAAWFAIFTWIALLTEFSPFTKTSLTELFRSGYSLATDGKEGATKAFHIAASLVWTLLLGLTVALILFPAVGALIERLQIATGPSKLGYGFAILVIASIVLSWTIDVLTSFSYDTKTAGAIRRLWKKKQNDVLEAVRASEPKPEDLEKLPFLRQIDPSQRGQLLRAAKVQEFNEGQAVCRQGETSRSLYVVLDGKFAVAKTASVGSGRATRRKVIAFLEPGAVFGEAAFFFGQPRTADIVAMQGARVLCIPHDESMKTLGSAEDEAKSKELQTRIWFLQALMRSSLFKNLPSEALDSVLLAGQRRVFTPGQRVIQEGEVADDCYFIVQGQVSVTQNTKLLTKLQAGDAFGEIAVLNPGILRTASVVADSDLIAISISGDRLWTLLKNHLTLALEIERLARVRLNQDRARASVQSK